MAQVRFTDGIDTVTFTGVQRSDFVLAAPDGENPVTESLEVVASSGAQARTDIQTLERFFARARERWANSTPETYARNLHIPPAYAQIDLAESGTWVRAEIIDGRAAVDAEALSAYAYATMVRYSITFTHVAGWEENTETAVTLTPSSGGAATQITVGTFDNFYVSGFNSGNLPARTRIELVNNTNTAARAAEVWLGMMRNAPGVNTQWVGRYEAEAGTGGAVQNDASCFGGQYRTFTWSGTAQTFLQSWTIPDADAGLVRGRRVRPVVRLRNGLYLNDLSVRFAVVYQGITELATTPWQRVNNSWGIHEAFSVPLPPRWLGGNPSGHSIVMYGRRASGASTTIEIDQLFLMASESFCRLRPSGYNLPFGYSLMLDGNTRTCYASDGVSRDGHYTLQGDYLTLWPGVFHSFSVAHKVDLGGATAINRTMRVRLWARPRRSTL